MTDLELEVIGKYLGKWKFFTTDTGKVGVTCKDLRICHDYIKFTGDIFFDRKQQKIVVDIWQQNQK